MTDVCNFADDTTFYRCSKDIKSLIQDLENDTLVAIEWFDFSYIKLNPEKCNFLFSGHCFESQFANVGQTKIWEKLLGVHIDRDLNFKYHVANLCKKANSFSSDKARQISTF